MLLKEKLNQAKGFKCVFPILLLMIAGGKMGMATERKKSEMKNMRKENRSEHKHLNTPSPNIEMMREMEAGRRVRPQGVSAEVVGMAGNKENGKAGKGSSEPFLNAEGTPELSEEEIMKILQARQQYERALEMARKYEEIMKSAEQKKKEIKPQVFKEIKEKYGIDEKEIRRAFKERERKKEIIDAIIDTIEKEGSKACENKQFREYMNAWKRIRTVEMMAEADVKKIAVFIDDARRFIEERMAEGGKKQIHHTGRMSVEAKEMLKHIRDEGGRIGWKEFLQWSKETLALDSDTINKRRWQLLTKGYLTREGNELVLTQKGYARLQEEGY